MERITEENRTTAVSSIADQSTSSETGELQLDLHDVCYYVTVGDETRHLLSNVNLHLNAGEMTALMGPSGAGIYARRRIVYDIVCLNASIKLQYSL
jgi:ABC-type transport system involved in cytochrome bd biosynthesis fused ATPase/permease subunit